MAFGNKEKAFLYTYIIYKKEIFNKIKKIIKSLFADINIETKDHFFEYLFYSDYIKFLQNFIGNKLEMISGLKIKDFYNLEKFFYFINFNPLLDRDQETLANYFDNLLIINQKLFNYFESNITDNRELKFSNLEIFLENKDKFINWINYQKKKDKYNDKKYNLF